ncbi:hypothetical protein SAMN05877753_112120 [Bacillus oleivorans]|uniref:Uncharacterized protein n=1 Tax=Bacillus oleivorans TaxID=1448271 RepID=A0A285D750_9BACI|nr:hypothetical protein [Bacillus oleivorans]SNX75475.1 hypothetical protein SAMN05877753_112120 [Bacillus oleivorans]
MTSQVENSKETKKNNTSDNEDLILQLEKQVSIAVWIQFIGQFMEAILLSKIASISEEIRSDPNERQIIHGVWIQSIGQLLESIGVTQQVITSDDYIQLKGQEITTLGDWIQVFGTLIEAQGGSRVLAEEIARMEAELFIP